MVPWNATPQQPNRHTNTKTTTSQTAIGAKTRKRKINNTPSLDLPPGTKHRSGICPGDVVNLGPRTATHVPQECNTETRVGTPKSRLSCYPLLCIFLQRQVVFYYLS